MRELFKVTTCPISKCIIQDMSAREGVMKDTDSVLRIQGLWHKEILRGTSLCRMENSFNSTGRKCLWNQLFHVVFSWPNVVWRPHIPQHIRRTFNHRTVSHVMWTAQPSGDLEGYFVRRWDKLLNFLYLLCAVYSMFLLLQLTLNTILKTFNVGSRPQQPSTK